MGAIGTGKDADCAPNRAAANVSSPTTRWRGLCRAVCCVCLLVVLAASGLTGVAPEALAFVRGTVWNLDVHAIPCNGDQYNHTSRTRLQGTAVISGVTSERPPTTWSLQSCVPHPCEPPDAATLTRMSTSLVRAVVQSAFDSRRGNASNAASSCLVAYPRPEFIAAQRSVDLLVPHFHSVHLPPSDSATRTAPHGIICSAGASQVVGAPKMFRWYGRQEALDVVRRAGGEVLVVGDSVSRRVVYQLAQMMCVGVAPATRRCHVETLSLTACLLWQVDAAAPVSRRQIPRPNTNGAADNVDVTGADVHVGSTTSTDCQSTAPLQAHYPPSERCGAVAWFARRVG